MVSETGRLEAWKTMAFLMTFWSIRRNPLLIDKSYNALYYGWLARIDPASLALYRSKLSIYYRRSEVRRIV